MQIIPLVLAAVLVYSLIAPWYRKASTSVHPLNLVVLGIAAWVAIFWILLYAAPILILAVLGMFTLALLDNELANRCFQHRTLVRVHH